MNRGNNYNQIFHFRTKAIDRRLGNIQKVFKLTGEEIRSVVCRRPQIIAMKKLTIQVILIHRKLIFELFSYLICLCYFIFQDKIFLFKDIIGFTFQQTKNLFLKQPYVWSLRKYHDTNFIHYLIHE